MPRQNAVLTHPNRNKIEAAILAGMPSRQIATQFGGVSFAAVHRYRTENMKAMLENAVARKELNVLSRASLQPKHVAEQEDRLLAAVDRKQARLEKHAELQAASDEPDLRGWAAIEGQHTAALRLEAELTGRLTQQASVTAQVLVLMPEQHEPARIERGDVIDVTPE